MPSTKTGENNGRGWFSALMVKKAGNNEPQRKMIKNVNTLFVLKIDCSICCINVVR